MTDELTEAVARAISFKVDRMGDTDAIERDRVEAEWPCYVSQATAAIAAVRAHDAANGLRLVKGEPVAWMYEREGDSWPTIQTYRSLECKPNQIEIELWAATNGGK